LEYGDLKVKKGGAGSRRGGEIGEEHRGEVSEGCLRVLQDPEAMVGIIGAKRGTDHYIGH
jgi:hypothetical protein